MEEKKQSSLEIIFSLLGFVSLVLSLFWSFYHKWWGVFSFDILAFLFFLRGGFWKALLVQTADDSWKEKIFSQEGLILFFVLTLISFPFSMYLGNIYLGEEKIVSPMSNTKEKEDVPEIEEDPDVPLDDISAAYRKVESYQQQGEIEKALALLEKVKETRPDDVPLLHRLADLYWEAGKNDKVIEIDLEAIAVNPEEAFPYLKLGLDYARIGNMEEAEKQMLKAIEVNSGLTETYYHLGKLYIQQEKKDQAQEIFSRCLEIAAENSPWRDNCQTEFDLL